MPLYCLCYHEMRDTPVTRAIPALPLKAASHYNDTLPAPLAIHTETFEAHLQYLKAENYYFASAKECWDYLQGRITLPEKSVMMTFDDAYQSTYHLAYPILKQYQVPATLFVVSSWIYKITENFDKNSAHVMAWDQLQEISDVFTTANHTHDLHQRPSTTDSRLTLADASTIQHDLQHIWPLVDLPHVLAYPFGYVQESTISHLQSQGIQMAFTTQAKPIIPKDNPFLLGRILVTQDCHLEKFQALLNQHT